MDPLAGVEDAALVEGVKFLYQQAAEVLSAWRARRRDGQAPPPDVVGLPGVVRVGRLRPLPDPASLEMADALQSLGTWVEPLKDGEVDPGAVAARQAVARLRELLEVIVGSPITFVGEPPRAVAVSDVEWWWSGWPARWLGCAPPWPGFRGQPLSARSGCAGAMWTVVVR